MTTHTSPFKFLDSYHQQDLKIFFGRKTETEALYDSLSGVKHLLVYGPSGAGKTSLVECGLRNQFSPADWYAISIRRGENMIASVYAGINEALLDKIEMDDQTGLPVDPDMDLGKAIDKLFNELFQPVYLLFDQFEELLLSGSQEEKMDFFTRLNQLIRYKVPCRVLLIMREEFIGYLSEFEPLCPTIFKYRYRLEKMTRSKVQAVIESILNAPYYESFFKVDHAPELASSILRKLPDERKEIDLSHVQVFLSELWDRSLDRGGITDRPQLDLGLIKTKDNLEGVLDSFLKKQLSDLAVDYGDDLPLEILAVMISERFTKLQLDRESIANALNQRGISFSDQQLLSLLGDLEARRIIRKLRSGEQTRYEISHDTLALVVGQNLTEEMRLREKAKDIYSVYEEKQGFYSQEDLDLLRPYQQYLAYPEELAVRIRQSETHLRQEEEQKLKEAEERANHEKGLRAVAELNAKRASLRTRIAAAVAIVAVIAAALAVNFYLDARQQKQEADKQKNEAEANLTKANQALLETQQEKLRSAEKNLQEREQAATKFLQLYGNIPEIVPFQLAADSARMERGHYKQIVDSIQNSLNP